MNLVKCPNCGKDTFDDYKCAYCKYILKKKENSFDKTIYNYLTEDYLKTKNKSETIKNGMIKFNMSMQEIKYIVDYIADEIYEQEDHKSKEEISNESYNNQPIISDNSKYLPLFTLIFSIIFPIILIFVAKITKNKTISISFAFFTIFLFICIISILRPKKHIEKNTFYYSFIQHFLHDIIYKIVFLIIMFYIPKYFQSNFLSNNSIFIIIWYIVEFIILIMILLKWAKISTSSFTINYENVTYRHQKPNYELWKTSETHKNDRKYNNLTWANYTEYEFHSIKKIEQTLNEIIIYGDIIKKESYVEISGRLIKGKDQNLQKIKIVKCFKNNRQLVELLHKNIKN